MSIASSIPIAADIKSILENYDTTNPVVAEIIKAKEKRLKFLQELNKEQQNEISSAGLELTGVQRKEENFNNVKKKIVKKRKPDCGFPQISIRRSARLSNSPRVYKEISEDYLSNTEPIKKTPIIRPPNDYGPIPGVEVGFHWETRMECSEYGVHRPTVAGIHGGPQGAYSIALSGGYPEDVDEGHFFIYTGAGGRDLKGTATKPKNLRTAPQTKDQQLEGTNLSLVKSIESKLPIRVIRGYKSPSIFAPETGYRYDGLYQVVKYWEDVGSTGYRIYRFRMERMENQAPPPWEQQKGKQFRKAEFTFDQSDNSSEEFKENVRPKEEEQQEEEEVEKDWRNQTEDRSSETVTPEEAKEVDVEIEKCIQFFCKSNSIQDWNAFRIGWNEEDEFSGWNEL